MRVFRLFEDGFERKFAVNVETAILWLDPEIIDMIACKTGRYPKRAVSTIDKGVSGPLIGQYWEFKAYLSEMD